MSKNGLESIGYTETITKISSDKRKATSEEPKISNFEYVTNFNVSKDNVEPISCSGRFRWKIENEGFNTQKRGDYELGHKICRNSYNGYKNYYTLLQIAHAINQFIEKGKYVTEILKQRPKESLHNLWLNLKGYMIFVKPVIEYFKLE